MKEFLIRVYDKIVTLLVFVGIIAGIIISYNFANIGIKFNTGIFLIGLIITIVVVALSCGLLLIQIQNNRLLKDIKKNTENKKL